MNIIKVDQYDKTNRKMQAKVNLKMDLNEKVKSCLFEKIYHGQSSDKNPSNDKNVQIKMSSLDVCIWVSYR
jgi:hypothetical protein